MPKPVLNRGVRMGALAVALTASALAQTSIPTDDCDNNGVPDVQIQGPPTAIWGGNYTGTSTAGLFNFGTTTTSNWRNVDGGVVGRPGTNSVATVNLPTSLPTSGGTIAFSCSNAVSTLTISDSTFRTTQMQFNLNGRTLVVMNETLGLQQNRGGVLTGIFEGGVLTSNNSRGLGLAFSTLAGQASWWLRNCSVVTPSVRYGDLRMSGGVLQTSAIQAGGTLQLEGTTVLLPSGYTWVMSSTLRNRAGDSLVRAGTTGGLRTLSGSLLDIERQLASEGYVTVEGDLRIHGHGTGASAGAIAAINVALAPSSASDRTTVTADLSSQVSRSSPVIDASSIASIRGVIEVEPIQGSEAAPLLGWTLPLARGGSGLYLTRRPIVRPTVPLVPGHYLVPQLRSTGRELDVAVRRGRFPAPGSLGNRDITQFIGRSAPLNGASRSRIAGIVNNGTFNASQMIVLVRSVNGTNSFDVQTTTTITANARDIDCGDLDGDGIQEIVVAFGTSGAATVIPSRVVAYKVTSSGVLSTYWTHTLPSGQSANCVSIVPAPGTALMPGTGVVGVGTTTSSGGSLKTLTGSTGSSSGETSTAEPVSRLKGADIDNDDDTDFTSTGESSAVATPVGVMRVFRRGTTGQFTAEAPIALPGTARDIAVGDVDGDGSTDVVLALAPIDRTQTAGSVPPAVVLQGASGGFLGAQPIDIGDPQAEGMAVRLLDADEDGDLDVALAWNVFGSTTLGGTTLVPLEPGTGGVAIGEPVLALNRPSHGLAVVPEGLASVASPASTGASSVALTELTGASVPGDIDGDGTVSTADLALLLLDFGPCTTRLCPADVDGSRSVDTGDIALLLLLFD